MSDGDLAITGRVVNNENNNDGVPDWVLLDYNKLDYQNYTRDLFTDALNKAAQENPPLDTSTDAFTKLVVIYAGNWWLGGGLHPASQPGLNRYRMSERLFYNSANQDPINAPFSHIGIHSHEFGHLLGFNDVYVGGNDHRWSLMNIGDKNGPTGIGGRTGSAPAPLNPEYRRRQGWIATQVISGAPQTFQADYSLQDPEVFQIDVPNSTYYFLIENRHFENGDFNSWLPSDFPSFVNSQGILTWQVASPTANPVLMPADNDFHQAPDGTASQGDHGDFFPGAANNRVFSPWSTPSSWPSDDDVAFEVISDNDTSFTVDFYSYNAVNASPAKPQNLTISGSFGDHPTLSWDANSEPDLAGYYVYRQRNGGPYGRISSLLTTPSFVDHQVTIDWTNPDYFRYYVTALDNSSKESTGSNEVEVHGYQSPRREVAEFREGEFPLLVSDLSQNHPNPFNSETRIRYTLPTASKVSLKLYNLRGQLVATIVEALQEAGRYDVRWNGRDDKGKAVSSGIYIYRLTAVPQGEEAQTYVRSAKMTIIR